MDAPNTYYRVTLKAVIRDNNGFVLAVKEASDQWDLPGGGFDHGLDLKQGLAKELSEEIDYAGDFTMQIAGSEVLGRRDKSGYLLFLIYEVTLSQPYTPHNGNDATAVAFINPAQYAGSHDRTQQMIYKYGTKDYSATIDYCLTSQ